MNWSKAHFLALTSVGALLFGQLLFKKVALSLSAAPLIQGLQDGRTAGILIAALCIYAGATVTWILALRDLPLGRAYMLMSIGFVLIPVLSFIFFGEPLSRRFLMGSLMIAGGIALTQS